MGQVEGWIRHERIPSSIALTMVSSHVESILRLGPFPVSLSKEITVSIKASDPNLPTIVMAWFIQVHEMSQTTRKVDPKRVNLHLAIFLIENIKRFILNAAK